jgi:hypothetical protein
LGRDDSGTEDGDGEKKTDDGNRKRIISEEGDQDFIGGWRQLARRGTSLHHKVASWKPARAIEREANLDGKRQSHEEDDKFTAGKFVVVEVNIQSGEDGSKDEEDCEGAGVEDELGKEKEWGMELKKYSRDGDKRNDQKNSTVEGVAARDGERRAEQSDARK